jgi:hypothetical protein
MKARGYEDAPLLTPLALSIAAMKCLRHHLPHHEGELRYPLIQPALFFRNALAVSQQHSEKKQQAEPEAHREADPEEYLHRPVKSGVKSCSPSSVHGRERTLRGILRTEEEDDIIEEQRETIDRGSRRGVVFFHSCGTVPVLLKK